MADTEAIPTRTWRSWRSSWRGSSTSTAGEAASQNPVSGAQSQELVTAAGSTEVASTVAVSDTSVSWNSPLPEALAPIYYSGTQQHDGINNELWTGGYKSQATECVAKNNVDPIPPGTFSPLAVLVMTRFLVGCSQPSVLQIIHGSAAPMTPTQPQKGCSACLVPGNEFPTCRDLLIPNWEHPALRKQILTACGHQFECDCRRDDNIPALLTPDLQLDIEKTR